MRQNHTQLQYILKFQPIACFETKSTEKAPLTDKISFPAGFHHHSVHFWQLKKEVGVFPVCPVVLTAILLFSNLSFKVNLHEPCSREIYISLLGSLSVVLQTCHLEAPAMTHIWISSAIAESYFIINNIIFLHLGFKKRIMHSNPILSQCPKMRYFGNKLK